MMDRKSLLIALHKATYELGLEIEAHLDRLITDREKESFQHLIQQIKRIVLDLEQT